MNFAVIYPCRDSIREAISASTSKTDNYTDKPGMRYTIAFFSCGMTKRQERPEWLRK
jgi:hypothetical protein